MAHRFHVLLKLPRTLKDLLINAAKGARVPKYGMFNE